MTKASYDAVVIGSGAAGSFAAHELTRQGMSILVLEAGRALSDGDFDPARKKGFKPGLNLIDRATAMLSGQHVQARAIFFKKWQKQLFINDRQNPYTTPRDAPFLWIRGRQSGGRLHSFSRVFPRWSDHDFRSASLPGIGEDWLIAYDDLAPFYAEAERQLGLHGNSDGVGSMPDGDFARPSTLTPAEQFFKQRLEGARPGEHAVAWRFMPGPYPQRVIAPMRQAMKTGLMELRTDAVVRRILTDPDTGLASGVEYIDARSKCVQRVVARSVVLCASPVESFRLLLNSACERHPDGLGNRSRTLGRNFMDQLPIVAQGRLPAVRGWARIEAASQDPFYAPSGGIFVTRRDDPQGGNKVGAFSFQGMIGRAPTPNDQAAQFAFFGFGEMLPDPANRITLDPSRRDAWGISVPHIDCRPRGEDHQAMKVQSEGFKQMIKAVEGEIDFVGSPLGLEEFGRGAYPDADAFSGWWRAAWCVVPHRWKASGCC